MPKESQLEYFYTPNDFDRAFKDSAGRVNNMKLGFAPKRPDKAKTMALLDKASKPPRRAQGWFMLVLTGQKVTFEVWAGPTKTVLNTMDLAAVKDIAKRRELMRQLSEHSQLITDKDLADFDKANADPEDGDAAIKLNKQVDDAKRAVENYQLMLDAPNYKKKEYSEWDSEFRAWVEAKNFDRFTAFVNDVDNGRGLSDRARAVLENAQTSGIKPATLAAINAAHERNEKPDYTQARKEVLKVIEQTLLPRYNKEKTGEYQQKIKDAKASIEKLTKQLKALKAS